MREKAETPESLAVHLRSMRWGLKRYRTGDRSDWPDAPARWSRLVDRYDAALVQAAVLLGVPVPGAPPRTPTARRRLSIEGRSQLENGLHAAGLDLTPSTSYLGSYERLP